MALTKQTVQCARQQVCTVVGGYNDAEGLFQYRPGLDRGDTSASIPFAVLNGSCYDWFLVVGGVRDFVVLIG